MMLDMTSSSRGVRKDVLRNRALLLESADAIVREHGIDLSLNAVAHHAGVGVGTVYRHFPDRDALMQAMFLQRVEQVTAILSVYVKAADPVVGLRDAVFAICEMQTADRGIWDIVSAGSSEGHRETVQATVLPLATRLVKRANASRRLRYRFEVNDLPVLLWTGGAWHDYLGDDAPNAWRRYVRLMINSFLADDDPARVPPDERAPTLDQVDAAMSKPRGRRAR